MENKTFTISVYSENNVGLLNRISVIFLKRHINILSLNVSESEIENVSRFVIVVDTTEKWVKNIVGQIEKQIEVIKAFYHIDEETIFLESAIFKINSSLLFDERQIQNIIKVQVKLSPISFSYQKYFCNQIQRTVKIATHNNEHY